MQQIWAFIITLFFSFETFLAYIYKLVVQITSYYKGSSYIKWLRINQFQIISEFIGVLSTLLIEANITRTVNSISSTTFFASLDCLLWFIGYILSKSCRRSTQSQTTPWANKFLPLKVSPIHSNFSTLSAWRILKDSPPYLLRTQKGIMIKFTQFLFTKNTLVKHQKYKSLKPLHDIQFSPSG